MRFDLGRSLASGAVILFLLATPAIGEDLRVASVGPEGDIARLEEAKEIRVVFSEPMVVLGRIPEKVEAPFFRVDPPVAGAFRWSGTRVLIFSPAAPLPFSSRYEVSIDGAVSAAGRRLEKPYRFAFTTPTVRLLRTSWYRKTGKSDSQVVLVFHFNQPVNREALPRGIRAALEPHDFQPPPMPSGVEQWKKLDPAGFAAFQAKLEKAAANAKSSAPVPLSPAKKWNRNWFPAKDDMAVFETATVAPVEGWIRIRFPAGLRAAQGKEATKKEQEVTVRLEPAFFVDGFRCDTACDPDSYNPLRFRARVAAAALRPALRMTDVTESRPGRPVARGKNPPAARDEEEEPSSLYPRTQGRDEYPESWTGAVTPEEAGFSLSPARTYRARVDANLRSEDGQVLGYTWIGILENWHQRAFTSFGSGHGVWESGGGLILPFYARNLKDVRQWIAPLRVEDLVPTLKAEEKASFATPPPGEGRIRRLSPESDKIQSFGLDVKPLLSTAGTGLVWAAVREGEAIPRAGHDRERRPGASLVQVTNLGISIKDSPKNTLLFVTRLDDGQPVAGARVSLRTADNEVFWSGTTGVDGTAIAPETALRDPEKWWEFSFLAIAEKDGDIAYAASNWNEGLSPWLFNVAFDLSESKPLLRGSVFPDHGVYKPGEEVHFKAVVRSDTADGIRLLPKDTEATFVVTDSHGKEIGERRLKLSEWGTADGVVKIPADGALGRYGMTVKAQGQKREVYGDFLVAAYRRPDFRVDANLAGESSVAGVRLAGVVTGNYLFGAPMGGRPIRWTYSRQRLHDVPRKVSESFPEERWAFLDEGFDERPRREEETIQTREAALDPEGRLTLTLDTKIDAGTPYSYTFEGEVTDVSRQQIAGRAAFRVDPAPWYVAVRRPPFFADTSAGVDTEISAVDLEGKAVAGVRVVATLKRVEWHSVRRGEGKGFYTWETEKREIDAGRWEIETKEQSVSLHVPVPSGGFFVLSATAHDEEGRSTATKASFYALGEGFTAWQRYDHNRIDLVPEKKTYRPGDVARLLVKSPWEKATALLTTEREGIRTHKRFDLASTQQTVEVRITEADIPNVYVSVLLVKGRTASYTDTDASDPGKPSYRLGYAELKVEDTSKRLTVAVRADREEYRPAAKARVEVSVSDGRGSPGPSEVTLWAVDYGVLSLTAYRTPSIVESVYVAKSLQVLTEDSRQNIINRRVIVAKGADEGGGGGVEEGPGQIRRDFRVLAFWLGSIVTDKGGKASSEVTLPESLTTYRIMAVAGDKVSRFGWGQIEIRVSKPLLLKAAFPRFLSSGDTALFGSVLSNQTAIQGDAIVTMQSLDPGVLEISGEPRRVVPVTPKSSTEVRFSVKAKSAGKARVRMTAKLSGESDAFEDVLPVEILSPPETVAAYGQANPSAKETVEVPPFVVADFGGLRVELSSTALVGLSEGARYLVDYPYGCAEQRASSAEALMLAGDLGDAFRLDGIDAAKAKEIARSTLKELEEFQCPGGGFAFWKGSCRLVSAYLTSYVLSVFQRAERLSYEVNRTVLEEGYRYLEHELATPIPGDEGWWPAYTAWQTFAVKVLANGGRYVDSHVNRLFERLDRMPVFALAYLSDAMAIRGEAGSRPEELKRRISNAILPEGGSAHVEELADPYLLWFWNSSIRSTAIVLESLVRRENDSSLAPGMVRWLLAARKNGRWGNTQENALALGALVEYYRRFEKEVPDFKSSVTLGEKTIARETFAGRSSESRAREVPMKELLAGTEPGRKMPLDFRKEGPGTLHYSARLRYIVDASQYAAMDQGIAVERIYQIERDGKTGEPASTCAAGDLVRVTLTVKLPKERRYVAVTDPLPAGLEPVEAWFATTAAGLAREQREAEDQGGDWMEWWQRGGFDHVERHDDRVLLFATRLSEGSHTFSYLARATTAGSFRAASARAEEMYEPEVFGRTASAAVEVKP